MRKNLLRLSLVFGLLMRLGLSSGTIGRRRKPKDIYLAGFFPMTPGTPEGAIGLGVKPAVELAIKHVNESPDILRGYRLHMYFNDTKCNAGVGLKSFFDMVHMEPRKLILFGGACSPVTDQIAKAARHWNLVQVTYADTHPMFTEKVFPHFFRVVPSENEFNPPRLSILRYYNWTRVGTLYQNEAKFALAHNNLVSELEKNNFTIVESQSFNDEITNQLDILLKKDIRIILGNFDEMWARRFFCDAYQKGIYGRKYQWLIVGMYSEEWWSKGSNQTSCTSKEIVIALKGTMVMEIQPLSSVDDITISRLTPSEYERHYVNLTKHYSRYHGYAYDGIWATALAIQEAGHRAHHHNRSLAKFRYKDPDWERLFVEALDRTSFEGVTGPVRFKENSRRGNVVIKQIVESENNSGDVMEHCIGEYSGVTRTLYLERCGKVSWSPGDRPPKDRTFRRIVQTRVDFTIYIILVITASLGIVLAICFLAINIKYRHNRQIKMSSPNLNNLIIIGCILTYSSVILLGLDSYLTSVESFPYICTARAWILMSGFTLSFGSMFSKTWRVHSIFTNVQLNKRPMKDSQLYLVVGTLIFIDVIIMTTWQVVDPFYRDTKELRPYTSNGDDDTVIIPRNEYCRSNHMTIFVCSIYAYKGLLMLFGAFLAWETRSVQIPALNDSKYVGMSVYNVAIMCVLGVAVSFVLTDEQTASFIIIAIFIIFCTTGTLCLVFVPKIIDLRRDPHGQMDRRGKPTIKTIGNAPRGRTPLQTMEDKVRIANKVNGKYKELLKVKDNDLEEAISEVGKEEAEKILENRLKPLSEQRKDAHVSFAVEVTDLSSSCSDRTSSQVPEQSNSAVSTTTILPGPVGNLRQPNEGNVTASSAMRDERKVFNGVVSNGEEVPGKIEGRLPLKGPLSNQDLFLDLSGTPPPSYETIVRHNQSLIAKKRAGVLNNSSKSSLVSRNSLDYLMEARSKDEEIVDLRRGSVQSSRRIVLREKKNVSQESIDSECCSEDWSRSKSYYRPRREEGYAPRTQDVSQNCQTFEDQATQTEDEEEEDPRSEEDFGSFERRKPGQSFNICSKCLGSFPLEKTHSLKNRCKKSDHVKEQDFEIIDNGAESSEILPIFHKLIEDKRSCGSRIFDSIDQEEKRNRNEFASARSCPDIAVKCDIVEYL